MEGVDDWDKASSFDAAHPRRSTSSLDAAAMSMPDSQETLVRIGCGALVGLLVGLAIIVGTVSYWANSIAVILGIVALSVAVCALIGWRFGDRFFHSLHKWIGWLR